MEEWFRLYELFQSNIYAYPRLSKADFCYFRIGGDGLANLLFCWARCLVTARRNGWRMIWPTWLSFKPKNWKVNPYDVRTYGDLFQRTAVYGVGLCKLPQVAFRKWVNEADVAHQPPPPGSGVMFRGMAGRFQPFLQELGVVKAALLEMTRPQHLAAYEVPAAPAIGIHLRLGDFVRRPDLETTVKLDNIEFQHVGELPRAGRHPLASRQTSPVRPPGPAKTPDGMGRG